MPTLSNKSNLSRRWLGVAALLAIAGWSIFMWASRTAAESQSGGLQPERVETQSAATETGSDLRHPTGAGTRQAHGDSPQLAAGNTLSEDWQGAELHAWQGVVLSAIGAQPLPQSEVTFRTAAGVLQAQTDAQGRFEFSVPLDLRGTLIARHGGYLERAKPNVRTGSKVYMSLVPSASIQGTYDGDPNGLSAKLFASDAAVRGIPVQTTDLDAQGRFRFEDLAPGLYSIRAGPGVYAILKHVPLEAGEQREVQLADLPASQVLTAQVLTRPGGKPVAQAGVWISFHTLGIPKDLERGTSRYSQTAGDGRFEFALGAGVRTNIVVVAPWGGEQSRRFLDAAPGDEQSSISIEIPAPARLAGRLLDLQGAPISGVVLRLEKSRAGQVPIGSNGESYKRYARLVTTDGEGAFDFGEVPAQENLVVVTKAASASDSKALGQAVLAQLKLKPGQRRSDLRLRLGLAVRLSGQVLDKHDRAFAGVELTILDGSGEALATGVSDAQGLYVIEDIPGAVGGVLSVQLRFDGHVLHGEPLKWPKRKPDAHQVLSIARSFRLARRSDMLGWILDDEGYGVQGVRIYLALKGGRRIPLGDGVSGQAGEFLFPVEQLLQGTVEVTLRSRSWRLPKGSRREWTWPLPQPLILQVKRVALEARAQIRGEVLVAGTGAAVPKLRIQNARGGVLETVGSRFFLRGINPGRLRLKLLAQGMETRILPPLDLAPGMDLDLGLIRLHRGCDLSLEVRGLTGKWPKGSRVRLRSLSSYDWDPDWKPRTLDLMKSGQRRGRNPAQFAKRAIPRGRWRLLMHIPGFQPVNQELNLRRGKAKIRVSLKRE